jgi:hypothetical protein
LTIQFNEARRGCVTVIEDLDEGVRVALRMSVRNWQTKASDQTNASDKEAVSEALAVIVKKAVGGPMGDCLPLGASQ